MIIFLHLNGNHLQSVTAWRGSGSQVTDSATYSKKLLGCYRSIIWHLTESDQKVSILYTSEFTLLLLSSCHIIKKPMTQIYC